MRLVEENTTTACFFIGRPARADNRLKAAMAETHSHDYFVTHRKEI
jgi:hypothetical protein